MRHSTRNAPKSCLEIARPGEESNVTVYFDFGVSEMYKIGEISRKYRED